MRKKIIKSILLGIFIFLFISLLIASLMQTVELKKEKAVSSYYMKRTLELLDSTKVSEMNEFFINELDSLKEEIKLKDSIINNYKNSR